jgi:hypothetical protein
MVYIWDEYGTNKYKLLDIKYMKHFNERGRDE